MIVVNRYRVAPGDAEEFRALARPALAALADRPGFLGGELGRSTDEPELWAMTTRWESVGAYRRALSGYQVKLNAVPLMHRAVDEPGAFEVLVEVVGGQLRERDSDRAQDADTAGPSGPA